MRDLPRLGLVLSGGGARGAYEAGVLHYARTALPAELCRAKFSVMCGASVGAINATVMAAHAHQPELQGEQIRAVWDGVDQNRIFRRDWAAVAKFTLRTLWGIAGNFARFDPGRAKRLPLARHFVSIFDTAPFPQYLNQLIDFSRVAQNIADGRLDALALTATNLTTDRVELFIHKREEVRYRGDYNWVETPIGMEHVMASAAIPFAFPPVKVGSTYYCDGGVRLNTPMSPAIQLGADRLLLIGMHSDAAIRTPGTLPPAEMPGMGRLLAAITEAVFQDRVRYDHEQLTRINRIVEWAEAVYGPDFLDRINAHLVQQGLHGDIANRGLKKIESLVITPSRDLSDVFAEQLSDNPYFDKVFSPFEKVALRLLDADPREGREVFSYLIFAPDYIRALLELGYADARVQHDRLVQFFSGAEIPREAAEIAAV